MDLLPNFEVRLAQNPNDLYAVQRLRFDVFVSEMGAIGLGIDFDQKLELDEYDPHCSHLMLLDRARGAALEDQVVGAYRLLTMQGAKDAGGFYSATEFDLSALLQSKRPLIELGRSCLRKPYRGGEAMFQAGCARGGRNSFWDGKLCGHRC
jgi:putative hemolysin